jgi:hypothetical protein
MDVFRGFGCASENVPLSNFEWVYCRVKRGRKPGEANA